MKANDIIEVYKTRFKKISKHYQNLLEDFDAKDIHHFRLEIKKLRAFIRLINSSATQHQCKIPGDVKSFYNLAGNIRNLQIHQQRMNALSKDLLFEAPHKYLLYLSEEEKLLHQQAREKAANLSFKNFESKLIDEAPGKLTGETINSFFKKNEMRLDEIISLSFIPDDGLHEVRKIMKDLMYNLNFTKSTASSVLRELRFMDTMTSTLGDFHDLCVGLSLLNSVYVTRMTEEDETRILNEIRNQLQLRKDDMKTEIVELLKNARQKNESNNRSQKQNEPVVFEFADNKHHV